MFDFGLGRRMRAGMACCAVLMLGLAGCDSITGEDDSSDDGGSSANAVSVIGATGSSVDVTGTWFGCAGSTEGTTYEFGDGTITITSTTHAELGCADAGTVSGDPIDAETNVLADQTLSGWSDTNSFGVTPPTRGDAAGTLDDPPTATPVEVIVDGSVLGTLVLLVDDSYSDGTQVMYRDTNSPAECVEVDGVAQCLHHTDSVTKQ